MSVVSGTLFRSALHAIGLLLVLSATACGGCGESISQGDRATIRVSPDTVIFDRIAIGETQDSFVEISNIGSSDLVVSGYRWTGSASEFSVAGLDDLVLAPGEETTIRIDYMPTDPERDEAVLVISANVSNPDAARVVVASQGQSSQIQAVPNPVLIDVDRLGTPFDVPVTLYNVGSRSFNIDQFEIESGTGDFSFDLGATQLPATIPADGSLEITVTYTPSTGGVHDDRLLVYCDADNCEPGFYAVELKGTAYTPYLVLSPPEIGFGTVPIDTTVTADITASNRGQAVAVIDRLSLAINLDDTDDEIGVLTVDGEPWEDGDTLEIEPSEESIITVYYTPTDNLPDSELLLVESNDPEVPIQEVRLNGRAAAPRLEVFPEVLEFGNVAFGFGPVEKRVTILNAGTDTLELDPLGFRDNTGAYVLANQDAMPTSLEPDESFELKVRFDPPDPALEPDDAYFATLFVLPTNDPTTQEKIVQLQGFRSDAPVCEIRTLPSTINFGTVPRGTRAEGFAVLRNVGSGPCDIQAVRLESSLIGFIFSNYFAYEGASIRVPSRLEPGEEFTVRASYFPRTLTPLGETFGDAGSIEVRVEDPYAGAGERNVSCGVVPGPFSGSTRICGINLQGRSAIADLAVIPNNIDFGAVTLGCNSQQQTARVYNTGTADVQVTGVRLEGCGSEVTLSGVGTLPRTLPRNGSMEFTLRYRPADVGETECTMVVEGTIEGGGSIVVPIRGEGVTTSRTVDYLEQVSGREVDVLFVVDNSGSMGEEQDNLSRNFSSFINVAQTWDADLHIGVVTTQIEGTIRHPSAGNTDPGELVGSPRIITSSTPSIASAFERNANVGTSDPGTAESGMESAHLALSDPNITNLEAPCDADCVDPYQCVSGVDGSGSLCGGHNRTFLRDGASLEIIFVSDEEDQSRASVDFFADFFQSLKGAYNTELFNASAIVGPASGCSSTDGDAAPGDRYIELANETGGAVRSICDREFSSALTDIGTRAFGLRRQFGLSRVADSTTVRVHRLSACPGGSRTPVSSGWRYDSASNSIVWEEAATPAAGTCFEVEYEAACF
jgi:hypothetical protein